MAVRNRKAQVHLIKIKSEYYKAVLEGKKKFELRIDDRNYQVGDIVQLMEIEGEMFTGYFTEVKITYVLRNCPEYGLQRGYCIFCWE